MCVRYKVVARRDLVRAKFIEEKIIIRVFGLAPGG